MPQRQSERQEILTVRSQNQQANILILPAVFLSSGGGNVDWFGLRHPVVRSIKVVPGVDLTIAGEAATCSKSEWSTLIGREGRDRALIGLEPYRTEIFS